MTRTNDYKLRSPPETTQLEDQKRVEFQDLYAFVEYNMYVYHRAHKEASQYNFTLS